MANGRFSLSIFDAVHRVSGDTVTGNFFYTCNETLHALESGIAPNFQEDGAACVHFFLGDYAFEAVWRDPLRYVGMLSRFGCVLTPDFSVYTDMPGPMQRWNVYRARAVGCIWQDAGLAVVPALTWGHPGTYDFCFGGLPEGGAVAVSTVGLANSEEKRGFFAGGASEAVRRVRPSRALAYGTPLDFDCGDAEVVWYASEQQERFARLREQRRGVEHGKGQQ